MFDALELIFEAVQKQIAQGQQRRATGGAQPPGPPALAQRPPAPARAPQMGAPAPVRPAVAAPSVAMGRLPDAIPYDRLPPLEPLDSLAPPAPPRPLANPLLDALRGGPALIGGIVVAQVLGPPASLRPHAAPTDTL